MSSPFGVLDFLPWNHPWNNNFYDSEKISKSIALMKEAGIGYLRMDFLWQDIEPKQNKFIFNKYDEIVRLLSEKDIKILGVLGYNVSWAAANWNQAADKLLFAKFSKEVVSRYKDRVKYWEVWNEPNNKFYWQPQDGMLNYVSLLKTVYDVIKNEDSGTCVLMGGLTSNIADSLRQIYKNGAKDYFDIVNIHPFVNPLLTGALGILHDIYNETYKVMQENNDDNKDIWFTELGCPGVKIPGNDNRWWLGMSPTEDEQAKWLKLIYGQPLKWKGVKKIFWAFFRDTNNHWHDGTDYLGIVRSDHSKKPAYEAYKSLAKNYEKSTGC